MRYIRYAFLAALGLVLGAMALANRGAVTLQLLPEGIAELVGLNREILLPLFVVIFGGIILGLLIGFMWEWLREHKLRAESSRKGSEVKKLEREVRRLKGRAAEGKDEVLALLDEAS
jgi:uncharacterized integral membrane protein